MCYTGMRRINEGYSLPPREEYPLHVGHLVEPPIPEEVPFEPRDFGEGPFVDADGQEFYLEGDFEGLQDFEAEEDYAPPASHPPVSVDEEDQEDDAYLRWMIQQASFQEDSSSEESDGVPRSHTQRLGVGRGRLIPDDGAPMRPPRWATALPPPDPDAGPSAGPSSRP